MPESSLNSRPDDAVPSAAGLYLQGELRSKGRSPGGEGALGYGAYCIVGPAVQRRDSLDVR
jgi:hypothetical protein